MVLAIGVPGFIIYLRKTDEKFVNSLTHLVCAKAYAFVRSSSFLYLALNKMKILIRKIFKSVYLCFDHL